MRYAFLNVPEILLKVSQAETREEKIRVLRQYPKPALKQILLWNYDPRLKFGLDTIPDYKPEDGPVGITLSSLDQEWRRLYLFTDVSIRRIGAQKAVPILTRMLESIHATEARVLVAALTKKLEVPGMTEDLVREAFPGLLPTNITASPTVSQVPVVPAVAEVASTIPPDPAVTKESKSKPKAEKPKAEKPKAEKPKAEKPKAEKKQGQKDKTLQTDGAEIGHTETPPG